MAKSHKKDPGSWLIKRRRDRDRHIQACQSGYFQPGKKFRQVHHILPVTCLSDGRISQAVSDDGDRVAMIRQCLKITAWDINAADNCIGLPLKPAFMHKLAPAGWDGLPCHQVDHPDYTEEVHGDLARKIWQPISRKAKECEVEARQLTSALNSASSRWRDELDRRGWRRGGTRHCWVNRSEPDMERSWFIPFSMADSPVKRSPPPRLEDFKGGMRAYLQKIFTAIG